MDDIEKIKKLDSSEKLKKLKELKAKKEKEIKEADEFIKKAEEEIVENNKRIDSISVPEIKETDISELFENDDETLESAVDVAVEELPEEQQPQYQVPTAFVDIEGIYNSLRNLSYINDWSSENFADFYSMTERLGELHDDVQEKIKQGYSISEDVTKNLVVSQSVEYNIRKYRKFG